MREIKFRAWNKVKKIMLTIFNNGQEDWYLPSWETRWEVMQFTGLRDKNGVEIYEGDIVNLEDEIYVVEFDCGAYGLRKNGMKRGNLYHYYSFCKTDHSPYVPEIIGNIYENPELLEDSIDE